MGGEILVREIARGGEIRRVKMMGEQGDIALCNLRSLRVMYVQYVRPTIFFNLACIGQKLTCIGATFLRSGRSGVEQPVI